jgi:hypothetical protein
MRNGHYLLPPLRPELQTAYDELNAKGDYQEARKAPFNSDCRIATFRRSRPNWAGMDSAGRRRRPY